MSNTITVQIKVNAPIEKVWNCWNSAGWQAFLNNFKKYTEGN